MAVRDDALTIGALSRRTGVAPSALRYYEELGLIPDAPRMSGQRRYPPETVELVGVILFLRDVGFSLQETKELLVSRADAPGAWRELVRRKSLELEERIAQAIAAKVALEHAGRCRHDDVFACPNFRQVIAARLAGTPLAEAHRH